MTILVNSKTPSGDKNFWATSWPCFADATALYGRQFQLDVAAEVTTRKCRKFFTLPETDALSVNWERDWFCNPPFDEKPAFIEYAHLQSRAGCGGMMLLPYEPATGWWRKHLSRGVIVYEPDGRYPFLERDGVTKKDGVNFASAFVLFPSFYVGESLRIPFMRGIGKGLIDDLTLMPEPTLEKKQNTELLKYVPF